MNYYSLSNDREWTINPNASPDCIGRRHACAVTCSFTCSFEFLAGFFMMLSFILVQAGNRSYNIRLEFTHHISTEQVVVLLRLQSSVRCVLPQTGCSKYERDDFPLCPYSLKSTDIHLQPLTCPMSQK